MIKTICQINIYIYIYIYIYICFFCFYFYFFYGAYSKPDRFQTICFVHTLKESIYLHFYAWVILLVYAVVSYFLMS